MDQQRIAFNQPLEFEIQDFPALISEEWIGIRDESKVIKITISNMGTFIAAQ